uniref:Uncharacterized protein n=1 Tax=viral metagenome TaxID=1070528 RepID=A0A6C0EQU7_9ZZZZ
MTQYFLNNENIHLLWDVLSEETIIKSQSSENITKIAESFKNNLNGFFEFEKSKSKNLIEMNKKYIVLILNFVKDNFKTKSNTKNKITIYPDNNIKNTEKELVTYDEIQNYKKSQFDEDLNKRQEEFINSMTIPIPETPIFTDTLVETPISEFEQTIKEITAQRNYDIEQINNTYNVNKSDEWLKSRQTSVKNDKLETKQIINSSNKVVQPKNVQNDVKYIKIENQLLDSKIYEEQIINLNDDKVNNKKTLSWGKNETREINNIYDNIDADSVYENNIFNKLKRVKTLQNIENSNISLSFNELNAENIKNKTNIESFKDYIKLTDKIERIEHNICLILELLKNKND